MTLEDGRSCTQDGSQTKHMLSFNYFSCWTARVSGHWHIETITRTMWSNKQVTIVTNRYSKLTYAIPTGRITFTHLATIFLENWILWNGIPKYELLHNSPQYVSRVFTALCPFFRAKKQMTPTYDQRTSGQVKR